VPALCIGLLSVGDYWSDNDCFLSSRGWRERVYAFEHVDVVDGGDVSHSDVLASDVKALVDSIEHNT